MKKRLDQHLVDQGLAPSKTKAQEMIELGQVSLQQGDLPCSVALKSSQKIDEEMCHVTISSQNLLQYVSRSGFKLEAALDEVKIDVTGWQALDIGQSTGGFTDCLLQKGARHVFGVDVASHELAQSLVADSRVTALTQTNARDLKNHNALQGLQFEIVVVDVSFISLSKIVPGLISFLCRGGVFLALVKPQYEVGTANIGKGGRVKNISSLDKLEKDMMQLMSSQGLVNSRYFSAKIKGRDGNQEYFIYAEKK